jgi:superfamily II DNA/RNA helicase
VTRAQPAVSAAVADAPARTIFETSDDLFDAPAKPTKRAAKPFAESAGSASPYRATSAFSAWNDDVFDGASSTAPRTAVASSAAATPASRAYPSLGPVGDVAGPVECDDDLDDDAIDDDGIDDDDDLYGAESGLAASAPASTSAGGAARGAQRESADLALLDAEALAAYQDDLEYYAGGLSASAMGGVSPRKGGVFSPHDLARLTPQQRYELTGFSPLKPNAADYARLASGALDPSTFAPGALPPWLLNRRPVIPLPAGMPASGVGAIRAFERALPFGLHENTTRVLGLPKELGGFGFARLSRVQERVIPALTQGMDALVRAPTGTGKTLAYLIPIVERLLARRTSPHQRSFSAVIVAPTRELALQIAACAQQLLALHTRYRESDYTVATLIGGGSSLHEDQQPLMADNPAIVVGTPGRLAAHVMQTPGFRTRMAGVDTLVLDEVDYLLALGFKHDVSTIIGAGRQYRQTCMLSATLSPAVRLVAHHALRLGHEVIDLIADPRGDSSETLKQVYEEKVRRDDERFARAVAAAAEAEVGSDPHAEGTDGVRAAVAARAAEARRSFGLVETDEFDMLDEEDDWAEDAAAAVQASAAAATAAGAATTDDQGSAPGTGVGTDIAARDAEEEHALALYVSETPQKARQMFVTAPIEDQLPTLARLFDDMGGRYRFARRSTLEGMGVLDELDAATAAVTARAGANAAAGVGAGASANGGAWAAGYDSEYEELKRAHGGRGNAPVANPFAPLPIPGTAAGAAAAGARVGGDDDLIPLLGAPPARRPPVPPRGSAAHGSLVAAVDDDAASGPESEGEIGVSAFGMFAETRDERERLIDERLPRPPKVVVFMPTARMAQFAAAVFRRVLRPQEPALGRGRARNKRLRKRDRAAALDHAWAAVLELHSRKGQNHRVRTVEAFGKRQWDNGVILFCSDVASRGLDFDDVDLVVQVGLPPSRNQYVHRVGRTARAGKDGQALLMVAPHEVPAAAKMLAGLPVNAPDLEEVELPSLSVLLSRVVAEQERQDAEEAVTAEAGTAGTETSAEGRASGAEAAAAAAAVAATEPVPAGVKASNDDAKLTSDEDDGDDYSDLSATETDFEQEDSKAQELWHGIVSRACAPLFLAPETAPEARAAVMEELYGQCMSSDTGGLRDPKTAFDSRLRATLSGVLHDQELGLDADRAYVAWLGLHRIRKLRSRTGDVLSVQLDSVKRPQGAAALTPAELLPLAQSTAAALGLRGPFGDGPLPKLPAETAAKLGLTDTPGFPVGEPRRWDRSAKVQGSKKKRHQRWARERHDSGEYTPKRTLNAQRREVMRGSEQMSRPQRGRTGEMHYKWRPSGDQDVPY